MKNLIISLLFLTNTSYLKSQSLTLKGDVLDFQDSNTNCVIQITDTSDTFFKSFICNKSFDIKLELNNSYIVSFIKDSCMTKSILVNTYTTENIDYIFIFSVKMIPFYESIYKPLIALVYYEETHRMFSYKLFK